MLKEDGMVGGILSIMRHQTGFIASWEPTASSASCKRSGNLFPRRSARLRIPRQAFGLKENSSATRSVSKTADNEDTTTTLGNSEALCVQHSVGPPVPEVPQRPEDGTHVPSAS